MSDHDDDTIPVDEVEFRLDSLVRERNGLIEHYRDTGDSRVVPIIESLDQRITKLSNRL